MLRRLLCLNDEILKLRDIEVLGARGPWSLLRKAEGSGRDAHARGICIAEWEDLSYWGNRALGQGHVVGILGQSA